MKLAKITPDEAKALELIKVNAAADPFGLEPFRRLGFWFKAFVTARRNGKDFLALHAAKNFFLLSETLLDVTGTTCVLFKGVSARRRLDAEARNA